MYSLLKDYKNIFFAGIAGTGMSAIAQYLKGKGCQISGSDRYFNVGEAEDIRQKLESEGIKCFPQGGLGIDQTVDLLVVSTAVEDTVPEVQEAKALGIPILKRSALLAMIAAAQKTIAVGGTSGKSTTCAILFDILEHAGLSPSIISGAGLVRLIKEGKIGNAAVGSGEWLIIEADESDGSIVSYHAEIGLLLNVDKDHKEISELMEIFNIFRNNSKQFIVNHSHVLSNSLSVNLGNDFSSNEQDPAGFTVTDFVQNGFISQFNINGVPFVVNAIGKHNMENIVAAVAVASKIGIPLDLAAESVAKYQGIYRRHQIIGQKNGIILVDDYAHNPVKCAVSIRACLPIAPKLIAWFQPHGFTPTKFLRKDFVDEIASALRPQDEIWMSEIFYAGGTAVKDISALDLINDLQLKGVNAFFVENREDFAEAIQTHLLGETVILLMGARDPSLEFFAQQVWGQI
ncbi:MAG: UDP-N-acetylmuramate--alanine ligase [Chitinophagaceae bacterium]|nr:UDP-N-acetylmuramate--alanine ligase [Chitinophagaceae bacterium]